MDNLSTQSSATTRLGADSYVTLHYRLSEVLTDNTDIELVSTFDLSPATIQMGSGQLAPPLESCLLGLREGDERSYILPPSEAFGEYQPQFVERISLAALPDGRPLEENTLHPFENKNGQHFSGLLRQLEQDSALFDFNHPLAGKQLRLDVKIIAVL